ncbi:MAG TPA: WD40 repeat domain-containing protein [Acetobacteraceae bacterium]|jgi:WD40 repeat protein|nr:WD40 repeat domain-containing protein [Acetobacteraceae bacterium]
MSQTKKAEFLVETRGEQRMLDAFVVAARFSRDGRTVAFGMGDGTTRLVAAANPSAEWHAVEVHDGATLCLAPDTGPSGFLSGGDDGSLRRIAAIGEVSDIASFGMKWVEQLASHALDKGKGLIAAGVGKSVHLFDETGNKLKEWTHPSTVTGLTFDTKGKRVATSHYNGATLWFVAAKVDTPRRLEWKGSHIALAFHPEGEAVVTAMQENALHGWRLPDGQHMRMSGYPTKTTSMSFSKGGKWLASSGSDAMVLWPFFGGGPMGKAPIELAGGDGVNCTVVACNPKEELVAGGFEDGLVVIADIGSSRILPVSPPGNGPVTALAWSPDGTRLALGTENGFAAMVDFAKRQG